VVLFDYKNLYAVEKLLKKMREKLYPFEKMDKEEKEAVIITVIGYPLLFSLILLF